LWFALAHVGTSEVRCWHRTIRRDIDDGLDSSDRPILLATIAPTHSETPTLASTTRSHGSRGPRSEFRRASRSPFTWPDFRHPCRRGSSGHARMTRDSRSRSVPRAESFIAATRRLPSSSSVANDSTSDSIAAPSRPPQSSSGSCGIGGRRIRVRARRPLSTNREKRSSSPTPR
jgi:hypothetical protein